MRKSMTVLMGTLALTVSAHGEGTFILCQSTGKEDIVVELDAREFGGKSLSCVSGGNGFTADMVTCAPDGAYALSNPSAVATLDRVVERWQDYTDHSGGVVSFFSTSSEYHFQGGWTGPEMGYDAHWTFEISRLTGAGKLTEYEPAPDSDERIPKTAMYRCSPAKRKF
jgi:hypothetical protein